MSIYASYPSTYRTHEVQTVAAASRAGECVSIVGLSGSGKSNLMGFLAYHLGDQPAEPNHIRYVLVDCNRLAHPGTAALFALLQDALADSLSPEQAAPPNTHTQLDAFAALEEAVRQSLRTSAGLCLLLDRFDALAAPGVERAELASMHANLRALRDAHKYALTYVTAARTPIDSHTELAELFYAHTLWLGPLSPADAHWSASRYASRQGLAWETAAIEQLVALSWGYPSFLRALCEAYAAGAALETQAMAEHPAVQRRVGEFLADQPTAEALRLSGLAGHPLLAASAPPARVDTSQLTAKEHLLWEYFCAHPNQVCEKDDLVRAVWPEDRIFERGIRDDSLAQLVRRLREKVEPDASTPHLILTVPGRGYRYNP